MLRWMCGTLVVLLLPHVALAKKVYSPHVERGIAELETQSDLLRSSDPAVNGGAKHQVELSYGMTEWWSSGLYAVFQKNSNQNSLRHVSTKWANILVLPSLDAIPLDWGVYAEYIRSSGRGRSDVFEGKLLFEEHGVRWSHTANVVLKQKLGRGGGVADIGYAWRSSYALGGQFIAFEAYGTLGKLNRLLPLSRQSHLLGPVVTLNMAEETKLELGWLMDPNAGPGYGSFKINAEISF